MRKPISFIESITVSARTDRAGEIESDSNAVRNCQRENNGKSSDHNDGTCLQDDVNFAMNIKAPDNP